MENLVHEYTTSKHLSVAGVFPPSPPPLQRLRLPSGRMSVPSMGSIGVDDTIIVCYAHTHDALLRETLRQVGVRFNEKLGFVHA